jgi:hypothetical protein
MLRPKKRISKKEMKEDALVTSYVRVTTFYEQNKKNISIAITALAVVVFATVIYFKNQADNNEKAIAQLGGRRTMRVSIKRPSTACPSGMFPA